MEICISDDFDYDEKNIDDAIDLKISVQMITHSLPQKTQEYMGTLLQKYLKECGMESYYQRLNYCLSETLVNAIKANMKRVYFCDCMLDINDPDDYKEGMKDFRSVMLEKKDYYLDKLCHSNLYVTYLLRIEDNKLVIEVRNNSVMTEEESKRVKEKLTDAGAYNPENFLDDNVDEMEGAGFGIKSIILTLRSFGLPGDHYLLYTDDDETVARLIIEQPVIEI